MFGGDAALAFGEPLLMPTQQAQIRVDGKKCEWGHHQPDDTKPNEQGIGLHPDVSQRQTDRPGDHVADDSHPLNMDTFARLRDDVLQSFTFQIIRIKKIARHALTLVLNYADADVSS